MRLKISYYNDLKVDSKEKFDKRIVVTKQIIIPRLRILYGLYTTQMPLLLSGKNKEGEVIDLPRILLTPKQLLHERIYCENEHDREMLIKNDFATACGVFGDPKRSGEIVIGLYSNPVVRELIHSLNPDQSWGGLELIEINVEQYKEIKADGFVIKPKEVKKLWNKKGFETDLGNEIWEYIAEGDSDLVDKNFKLIKNEKHSYKRHKTVDIFWYAGMSLLIIGSFGYSSYNIGKVGIFFEPKHPVNIAGIIAPDALDGYQIIGENGCEISKDPKVSVQTPTLDQVLELSQNHVSKAEMTAFEKALKKLYKR